MTLVLSLMSRFYLFRLIKSSGCRMDAMDSYILDDEVNELQHGNKDRISFKELKKVIEKTTKSRKQSKASNRPAVMRRASELWAKTRIIKPVLRTVRKSGPDSPEADTTASTSAKSASIASKKLWSRARAIKAITRLGNYSPKVHEAEDLDLDNPPSIETSVSDPTTVRRTIIDASSSKHTQDNVSDNIKVQEQRKRSLLLDIKRKNLLGAGFRSGIFLFDRPYIYFWFRDTGYEYMVVCVYIIQLFNSVNNFRNLFICLFLSFYTVTFSEAALRTDNPFIWCAVPLIILCGMY